MRNISRIITLLVVLLSCATSFSAMAMSTPADTSIVIEPYPHGTGGDGPRSPALVPISASYEAMLSTVFLTFTSNLGEIEVEVMNTTTGGYDSVTIDTQFLYATVPITTGSGHYLILFTLPSGQRYKGELDNYSNLFTCVMQGF